MRQLKKEIGEIAQITGHNSYEIRRVARYLSSGCAHSWHIPSFADRPVPLDKSEKRILSDLIDRGLIVEAA
jgi:hypothetical protein